MISQYLEATNLTPSATSKEIKKFAQDAARLNCLGVCSYLGNALLLKKYAPNQKIVCVVGFPEGDPSHILQDLDMAMNCIDEYDVVVPRAYIVMKQYRAFKKIMDLVRQATEGKVLKAIIETSYLTEAKFQPVIKICEACGVDIIKTNTGKYVRIRSLEDDVKLIQKYTKLPIKASGGIGTYKEAKTLIDLGVTRIGTSKADAIISGEPK